MKSARVGSIHFFWPDKTLMRSQSFDKSFGADERAMLGRAFLLPSLRTAFAGLLTPRKPFETSLVVERCDCELRPPKGRDPRT
jgi:hypothetical protein